MPPGNIFITIQAADETAAAFSQVKQELLELQNLQNRVSGDQASRQRIEQIKAESQLRKDASAERREEIRANSKAKADASREGIALLRSEETQAKAVERTRQEGLRGTREAARRASAENIERSRSEREARKLQSREDITLINAEDKERARVSRQEITRINTEQREKDRMSREDITLINAENKERDRIHRDNITRIKSRDEENKRAHRERLKESDARVSQQRFADNAAKRSLQSQQLAERALGREQRERFSRIRQEQGRISRGFGGWTTQIGFVGEAITSEILYALGRVARRTLEVTQNFERLRLGIAAYEGSTTLADAQIRRIRNLAELPGVQFEAGLRTVTRLRGAGITFEQSERLIREVSNLASLAGATQVDVGEALRQVQQIVSVGRFQTENLRPIFERIPQLREIFQQEFGGSIGEQIQESVDEAGLSISQAFDKVLDRAEAFVRAPEDTLANAIERLNDNFDDLLRGIGSDLTPLLKDLINGLSSFLKFLNENRTALYGAIGGGATAFTISTLAAAGGGFTGGATSPGSVSGSEIAQYRRLLQGQGGAFQNPTFRQRYAFFRGQGGELGTATRTLPSGQRVNVTFTETRPGEAGPPPPSAAELNRIRSGGASGGFARGGTPPGAPPLGTIPGTTPPGGRQTYSVREAARAAGLTSPSRFGRGTTALLSNRAGATAVGTGIGFGLGIIVESVADEIHGPERPGGPGPSPLTLALREGAQAVRDQVEIYRKRFPEFDQAFVGLTTEFNRFAETGRRQEKRFDTANRNLFKAYDALTASANTTSGRLRRTLAENLAEIETERALPDLNVITGPGGTFGGEGLSERQVQLIEGLEAENRLIERALTEIERTTESRRNAIQALARQLLRGSRDPELLTFTERLTPEEAGVIPSLNRQRRVGADLFRRQPTPFAEQELRRGPIQRERPAIPEGIAPSGTIENLEVTSEAYRAFSQLVIKSNDEIRESLLELPAPIGDSGLTNQEIIERGFQQTIQGLRTDASALAESRTEVTTLTEEWQQLRETLRDFDRETPLREAFSPANRQLISNTAKELVELRMEIVNVISEFEDPGLIPRSAITAVNDISRALRALDENLELAREAARDFREELIDDSIRLTDEEFSQRFPELTQFPTEQNIFNHPYFRRLRDENRRQREALEEQQINRERQIGDYFGGATESLYDQFIGPSILDAVGIGSGQSRAQERALQSLTEDTERARQEIRDNERLNERQQAEELLEITREFEREKREIERQYEEDRSDAWANWVRQQLLDFPKLIFQQLNLQLATRATNSILNSLGLGGNIPISPGGLLQGSGAGSESGIIPGIFNNLIGSASRGAAAGGTGVGTTGAGGLGTGTAGGAAGGTGAAGAAATVGVAASVALAAHNVGTGIQEGLYDDVGRDIANLPVIDSIVTFFDNLAFHDPINDAIANAAGRESSQRMAARLGRESATDIVSNFSDGFNERTSSSDGFQEDSNVYMIPGNTSITIPFEINDQIVKEISFSMDELASNGRI